MVLLSNLIQAGVWSVLLSLLNTILSLWKTLFTHVYFYIMQTNKSLLSVLDWVVCTKNFGNVAVCMETGPVTCQ